MADLDVVPEMIASARAGDRAAMEAVLASVAPSISRFALRMCRNEADADDVLQDALLAVTTNLDRFEGRSSLKSWAFTLARSACARKRRGHKNRPAEDLDALRTQASEGARPDDRAASNETNAIVARALDGLSDDHREVLLLRDAEGLTAPEAAHVLGISTDALKSRLHRARAALREALQPVLEQGAPPATRSCPDVVAALSRKLEAELDADTCKAMEAHVEGCPSCARTCDALKEALRACRISENGVSPQVRARIREAMARCATR